MRGQPASRTRCPVDGAVRVWQSRRVLWKLALFVTAIVFFVLASLRYGKGVFPLRAVKGRVLPSFPAPEGLIARLDGFDRRSREVKTSFMPCVLKDGGVAFPKRWSHEITIGSVAGVAHTWALACMAEADPEGHKVRENALLRAAIVPFLSFLVLTVLCVLGRIPVSAAVAALAIVWVLMAFSAVMSQMREWKAVEVAKAGLREAGLWPKMPGTSAALEQALKAHAWCRVGGFFRYYAR